LKDIVREVLSEQARSQQPPQVPPLMQMEACSVVVESHRRMLD
jgi:hypothetical protein